MKLTDFVVKDSINTSLTATTKEEAITMMVTSLVESGQIEADNKDSVVAAVMKREELGSTGIGKGIAVPHTKHPSTEKLVATIALHGEGLDFASLDDEPVYILFLLISPPDQRGDHLRALETVSRHLRNDTFCKLLRQANNADDVIELLNEYDSE